MVEVRMQLLNVNIGGRRSQAKGDQIEITGIYKMPVDGPIRIATLGIQEDFIGDQKYHGGPDQAVYVYGQEDYDWWSRELGRRLDPGTFGENLTIDDLESAHFRIGDRLRIGSSILEVTAPRTPCSTLARRMGDPLFIRKYRGAERPGLYCRVIREGEVKAGDAVNSEAHSGEAVAVIDIFREHYEKVKEEATLQRFLSAPVALRTRALLERHLQRIREQA